MQIAASAASSADIEAIWNTLFGIAYIPSAVQASLKRYAKTGSAERFFRSIRRAQFDANFLSRGHGLVLPKDTTVEIGFGTRHGKTP